MFLGQYFALFFRNLESYNDIVGKSALLLLHPHQFLKYSMYHLVSIKRGFYGAVKKFQNSRKTDPSFLVLENRERSCDKTTNNNILKNPVNKIIESQHEHIFVSFMDVKCK